MHERDIYILWDGSDYGFKVNFEKPKNIEIIPAGEKITVIDSQGNKHTETLDKDMQIIYFGPYLTGYIH